MNTVRMTVTMSAVAGRRYGGRSKFAASQDYADARTALADLRDTFGGITNQRTEDYLADLERAGIIVQIDPI